MGEMHERRTDFELLQRFVRHSEQSAFADVVRRHLDLVFATALRKLTEPQAAQEVTQNVFTVLARKAWQFAPDDSLPAWLHKTALLESKSWLRGELRRRRREQTAAELGTTMKTPDDQPAFHALVPLLDEALLSLREKDRTALLLRFYESQSLRDVGSSLGVSEDTAQKRVQTALERLAEFFRHRGFKTATVAASTAALQHTAASASAATANVVVNAALQAAPPALAGLAALLARLASLTKVQTAAVCLAVAAGPVVWQWSEANSTRQAAAQARSQWEATQLRHAQISIEVERLQAVSEQLQTALVNATSAQAQREEMALRMAGIRERAGRMLTDADYGWSEDFPFVRIPKSALAYFDVGLPIQPPGFVSPHARELFGLTPTERQTTEDALARYFGALDQLIEARGYETNRPSQRWMVPSDAEVSRVYVIPALGEEIQSAVIQLFTDIELAVGKERAAFVETTARMSGSHSLRRVLNLDAGRDAQEISVWIRQVNDQPVVGYTYRAPMNSFSSSGMNLESFLPARDETESSGGPNLKTLFLPDSIVNRIETWLGEEAKARLTRSSPP